MATSFAPAIYNSPLLPETENKLSKLLGIPDTVPDFSQEISLHDGAQIVIRKIRPDDKTAIIAFHNRLSDETRFLRYHYSKGQLTEKELRDLCDVDGKTTLALVAETERDGKPEIIGIGNYIRLPFDHTAEVAFAVQDIDQNKGIGTQLLKHLSIMAWQKEIYFFFGEVLRHNGKMLTIFRKADPAMKQEVDGASTCTVTISVAEAMHRIP